VVERDRSRQSELIVSGADDAGSTAHYDDPDYYDQAYRSRRDDVAYYVRLGRRSKGPVLEYGVGTGRIALELARAGVAVTGVDRSAPMLRSLSARVAEEPDLVRRRVRIVRGDMRSVRLRERFPLVIAAFNTVLHLHSRSDFERFFARVREHLTPRGRFVFDFSIPQAEYIGVDPRRRFGAPRFRHPSRGLVKYAERFEYDPLRQVLLTEMHFSPTDGSSPFMVPLTHRQLFPAEIEALLHYNGFSDLEWRADFTDAAPDWDVDSLVVSARVAGARSRAGARPRARGARRPGRAAGRSRSSR
jgi:SAM-dependent methyltransferase